MSFLFVLLNRRQERNERRRAALRDLVAPPAEHRLLGLGGRSIELSRAQGLPISPDAVVLAADALHEVVQRMHDSEPHVPMDDLRAGRRSASFLAEAASGVDVPDDIRHSISRDAAALARME